MGVRQLRFGRRRPSVRRSNLTGDTTFNQNEQFLTNVSQLDEELRLQPGRRRTDRERHGRGSTRRVPLSGREQDRGRQLLRRRSVAVPATSPTRAGRASTTATSAASRAVSTAQLSAARTRCHYYHDEQDKVRGHWGIAANSPAGSLGDPGDADELRVGLEMDADARPTGCCSTPASASTTRSIRRTISRTCSLARSARDASSTAAPTRTRTRGTTRPITSRSCSPNSSPHRTSPARMRCASARRSARHSGGSTQQWTGDVAAGHLQRLRQRQLNPVSVTLRIPTDRRNSIKNDSAVFAQDKWTISRATINAGLRWDWFISATDARNASGQHVEPGGHLQRRARMASTT